MAKLLTKHASQKSLLVGTKAYAELRQIVEKEGILDRAYSYYSILTAFAVGGFFVSAYYIFITPTSSLLALWAFLFAFFSVQIGGLLHDAGHRAIAQTTNANDALGHFFGSLIAASFGDWKYTHNIHHAHPNEEDEDPDIELPFHAFTKKRFFEEKGITYILRRYQMWLFYPLRTLFVFTRRFTDIRYFRREFGIGIIWQIILFVVGVFAWFFLPFLIFDLGKALVVFIIIHTTVGFYTSNVFAPNHKGMPQVKKGLKLSFFERQVITARNIYPHWLTDFMYMGLNYQIEHHLFPNCPRNKLHKITPYLLEICRRMKLEYTQVSVLESNKIILRELKQIAATSGK